MRRRVVSLMAAFAVAGVMSLSMPAATAQVGYPPGPCTPANTVFDAGSHAIGSTFTISLVTHCLWDPGNTVTLTVNGQAAGTKIVDGASGVTVNITVVSATQLAINDPILVSGGCGENKVVGVSSSSAASGANETSTAVFRVSCPGAARTGSVSGGIAFTGANILRWGGIALAMVAGGWLLVVFARRRRANPTA